MHASPTNDPAPSEAAGCAVAPSNLFVSWFQRVWNNGEEDAITELMHPACEVHGLGEEPLRGPEAFRAFWHSLNGTFGDIQIQVDETIECGTNVFGRATVEMSFHGKPVRMEGCSTMIVDAETGRILSAWNCWDFLALMADMGALPKDAFERACRGAPLA